MMNKRKNKIAKISDHRLCCIFDRRIQAVLLRKFTISTAVVITLGILLAAPFSAGAVLTALEKSNYREQILAVSRQVRLSWKHPRNAAPLYLAVAYTADPDRPCISLPLRRLDTGEPVQYTFNYHGRVQSRSPLGLPQAYVIRAYQKLFAELLDRHHIAYSTPDTRIPASGAMRPVEFPPAAAICGDSGGSILTEAEGSPKYSFQPGDLLVSLDQPARRLIPLLLEPRSSSSIFSAPEYRRLLQDSGNFLFKY